MSKRKKQDKERQAKAPAAPERQDAAQNGAPSSEQQQGEAQQSEAQRELDQARAEIAELKDKLLRVHAEMDNLRKRAERQVEEAHKFAIEKFAVALLDVIDNLERALEAEAGNEEAVREGIRLTLNQWHDVMRRFSIERIDAVGESFDPHRHEALSQVPGDAPAGTVLAQHVAGYLLNGRLIRPAKVLVSSGPAEGGGKDGDQAGKDTDGDA